MKSKHIGIVGISAAGTALCYTTIIAESVKILGAHRHPTITIHSTSFDEIVAAQKQKDWIVLGDLLLNSISALVKIGADFVIIPANSVHYSIEYIQKKSPIPVLDLIDIVVDEVHQRKIGSVAVLGVGATMDDDLYKSYLQKRNINYLKPTADEQKNLDKIIYGELVKGEINAESTKEILKIINRLHYQNIGGLVLGCTELPMVINEKNSPLPIFDSTRLLALKAVKFSLGDTITSHQ